MTGCRLRLSDYLFYGWVLSGIRLIVELADPQLKKVVWRGIGEDTLTDDRDKDLPMIQETISKMFKKYPPPLKK
jgi:Domain of unknown function (DUF4136)